jgi:CheY-like chemotaxis protein
VKATREIRKLERCQSLPIVAMTANAMQQDRERCVEAGMNDHLAKPVEPEELYRLLFKYLGGRAQAVSPASNDLQKAAALLKELAEKLASGDGAAADLVRTNAGLLQTALGADVYQKLDSLTTGFDFDQALELIQPLATGS